MANSGRKDPFFRKGGEGLMSKYEPSSRFTYDRERSKNDKDLYRLHELEVKKEREKKYGEHHKLEDGFVGYSNLPKQIYRKSVNEKFEFTLMVVGASGLGKSTLINSLFLTDLYGEEYLGPSHRIHKTVNIESTCVLLHENGVTLKLTIVDTPGFGDYVDNTDCWQPIIEYIDLKYEEYLNDEFRMKVEIHGDKRVHVLLYFLAPTGHSLRPLDIEFMKNLHEKVNIVPLIAKADTMTVEECHLFKKTILSEIKDHKIKIYELPEREDEKENMIQKKLRDRIPFAVVGSNKFIDSAGKRVRGRQYPWGTVEIENLEHSDFLALRCMVIRTHMQDLKDITHSTHYENYRQFKLGAINEDGTEIESFTANSLSEIAKERDNDEELKKIEAEMERVFDLKMKEKTQNMKNSEEILVNRAQVMQKSLAKEQKELKEKWKAFEKEKKAWEDEYGDKFPCFKLKDKEVKSHRF